MRTLIVREMLEHLAAINLGNGIHRELPRIVSADGGLVIRRSSPFAQPRLTPDLGRQ